MFRFVVLSFLLAIASQRAYAAVLPTSTQAVPAAVSHGPPVLTAAPSPHDLLRAREVNTGFVCGQGGGNISVTCNDHTQVCAGQVFPNGNAYQYCSTPGFQNQFVATTAFPYGHWSSCPSSAVCCPSTAPNIWLDLYIAYSSTYSYTVTGFECNNISTVYTWNPATNLLDPASFTASLFSLTHTPTFSSSSSSTSSSTTSSASASSTAHHHHGMPEGEKIGLGVGIGVGIFGIALVAAAIWLLSPWLCGRKR